MKISVVTPAQAGVHVRKNWIPAFAGMTCVRWFSGEPQAVLSETKEELDSRLRGNDMRTAEILRFAQNDSVQGFFRSLLER
jgi:hypothetical protein